MTASEESQTSQPAEIKMVSASARAAVLESSLDSKNVICHLRLLKTETGTCEIEVQGDGSRAEEVRQSVIAASALLLNTAPPSENAKEVHLEGWETVLNGLRDSGFAVESLPDSDHCFTMSVDLSSGRMLSSVDVMHPFTTPNEELTKRIAEAVANAFTEPAASLARRIEECLSNADNDGAAIAISEARDQGKLAFPPSQDLLKALQAIDVETLSRERRLSVRLVRSAIASVLASWQAVGTDADAILAEYKGSLSDEEIVDLRLASATSALKAGRHESGMFAINQLLSVEGGLPARKRGWCWRNISLILQANDPGARDAARQSADAFIQGGDKKEAAKSLVRLSDCLFFSRPEDALTALDEMFALAGKEGIDDRDLGSGAKHIKAARLSELGRHQEAFADAMMAVELRRGIIGLETQLVSSLYLASGEAERAGHPAEAKRLIEEADARAQSNPDPQHRFAAEISELFKCFDKAKAEDLAKRAKAVSAIEIAASVNILLAEMDPDLEESERIDLLERTLSDLDVAQVHEQQKDPARLALALRLQRQNQEGRAEGWFRKLLASSPNNFSTRNRLLQCLWNQKRWSAADELLRGEIERFGKTASLLYARGKSLVEASEFTEAVPLLTEAIALAEDDQTKELSRVMRERALDSGGTVPPPQPDQYPIAPISYEELESAMTDFAKFVAADKRMSFWVLDDKNAHKWVGSPERRAKDFLHIFLKARFRNRLDIFEEIGAGAGRIDLYLKFGNGLSAVLELKMCGNGYSSTYAASGEDQIIHYLENRDTRRGYLVVFDARAKDYGKALLKSPVEGRFTVGERFVDLRPKVKMKPEPLEQGEKSS